MLNAGSVIDILRIRKTVLGEENTGRAEKVVNGIHRCATVHGKDGFLVRGVTLDGKSCYANSSRDQFTLAVFGLWRLGGGLGTGSEKRGVCSPCYRPLLRGNRDGGQ